MQGILLTEQLSQVGHRLQNVLAFVNSNNLVIFLSLLLL